MDSWTPRNSWEWAGQEQVNNNTYWTPDLSRSYPMCVFQFCLVVFFTNAVISNSYLYMSLIEREFIKNEWSSWISRQTGKTEDSNSLKGKYFSVVANFGGTVIESNNEETEMKTSIFIKTRYCSYGLMAWGRTCWSLVWGFLLQNHEE